MFRPIEDIHDFFRWKNGAVTVTLWELTVFLEGCLARDGRVSTAFTTEVSLVPTPIRKDITVLTVVLDRV